MSEATMAPVGKSVLKPEDHGVRTIGEVHTRHIYEGSEGWQFRQEPTGVLTPEQQKQVSLTLLLTETKSD
jgi:hypothetical protein